MPRYATTRPNNMEPSASSQSVSFPLPDTTTTTTTTTTTVPVLSPQELRRRRLAALGVVAQDNEHNNNDTTVPLPRRRSKEHEQQQPRKRPAIDANAVIDLCDDSDSDNSDYEGAAVIRAMNGAAVQQRATASTRPAANTNTTTTTAARPLTLASDSEDEDIVELAKKREQEKRQRAKKRAAAVSNPYAAKAPTTAKANPSTASQETSSRAKPFHWQVATYNVWFGPNQEGDPHPEERMSALCRELLQTSEPTSMSLTPVLPLLFCGFQEVVPALNVPLERVLQASGYKVFSQPGAHYGCALAVKCRGPDAVAVLDAGWQGFTETNMARGFLHVRARLPNTEQQVLFTTTHLESWAGKDHTGMTQRRKQVQEMEAFCNQQLELYPNLQAAIITGDLNWDDERRNPVDAAMSTVLRTTWKDAWLETKRGTKDVCYTYDGKMNPMLGNNLRRRFDRVLIRCRSDDSPRLVPTTTRLIGTQAIPGLTFRKENPYTKTSREYAVAPSDHFGFVAHLQTSPL
jgi:hypothetical protein